MGCDTDCLVYPSHSPNSVPIVECLGFIGPGAKEAVPTLMEYIDHPDVNLRSSLVWALFRIAPDFDGTREYIRKAAQDKSERVRAAGKSALKELRKHDDANKSDAGGGQPRLIGTVGSFGSRDSINEEMALICWIPRS
jgi:hypothetical protein